MSTTIKALLISIAFVATMASASYAGQTARLLHFAAAETKAELKAMVGKRVLGKSGELLGNIEKVDEQSKMIEMKTPSGAIVSLSTDLLVEDGDHFSAPLSRGDIIAMIDKPGQESNIREAGVTTTP